jgi:predicted HicB family RNase H-like nuclease
MLARGIDEMKRQTGFRLTEKAHEWLKEQAKQRGISRNDVVQEMINEKIEKAKKPE